MPVSADHNGVKTDQTQTETHTEEAARVCLQHSPYRAIRRVQCRFHDGTLTLEGRVPTFHYKQLAQTAVAKIKGVTSIVNAIEVDASP